MKLKSAYYRELVRRTRIYQRLYAAKPKKAAIRLIWWNIKSLFWTYVRDNFAEISFPAQSDNKNIYILFELTGGVGDRVLAANYIAAFRNKYGYEHICIDVVVKAADKDRAIFRNGYVIDHIYAACAFDFELAEKRYDLWVSLERHPFIESQNLIKINLLRPELTEYIDAIETCYRKYYPVFEKRDGAYELRKTKLDILLGKKRIWQADIGGFLHIGEEPLYRLPMDEDERYMEALHLVPGEFITVHRGNDANLSKDNNKLWGHESYVELIAMIKEQFPDLTIVQMGISKKRCPQMKGIDRNLVGETSMEQVKLLLKNSLLHIDGEGGMVHMRHMLSGGASIVLFGPTPVSFYGYSENINIKGSGCPQCCEWCVSGWHETCTKGLDVPDCMSDITPTGVFEAFKKFMNGVTGN